MVLKSEVKKVIKQMFYELGLECLVSILSNSVQIYVLEKDMANLRSRYSKPFDANEYLATLIYNHNSIPSGVRINIQVLPEPQPLNITICTNYNGDK